MKHNLKTYPSCNNCLVFEKIKTYYSRASACEVARAVDDCPKDKWFEDFEAELRLKLSLKSTIFENGVETIRKILGESHG